MRTKPSSQPETTMAPSALTPTPHTKSVLPAKLRTLPPLSTFYILMVASPLEVTNSGFLPTKTSRVTCLPCAWMVCFCSPVSKFQTLMTLSAPALASSLPSDFQPTSRTWCVCPSNDLTNLPLGTSHTFTNLSAPQLASILSSGLKQTPKTVSLCALLMSMIS